MHPEVTLIFLRQELGFVGPGVCVLGLMSLPLQQELKRQGLSIIKNTSKIDSEKLLPINCVMWSAMAVSMHPNSQNGAKVDLLKSPKLSRSCHI